jgi:iron complex transport system substrate-binding protein
MRIVSLLSSATEILFGIGAGEDVVAISHECDYPPAATRLPRATKSIVDSSRPSAEIDEQVKHLMGAGEPLYEIDRDLIRSLAPDLIVTQAQCDVCAVRYQDVVDFVAGEPGLAGAEILALNPQMFFEVLSQIDLIGQAAGAWKAADALKRSLLARYNAIMDRTHHEQFPSKPRVAVIEWTEPLMAAGNWTPELVAAAGGTAIGAAVGEPSGYLTWLDIVAARPEVMIVAPCGFNLERSMVEASRLVRLPGYHDLPAVTASRAYVMDGNAYLNRSGPRIVDSLEILAHLIRPDLFGPLPGALAEGQAWSRLNP